MKKILKKINTRKVKVIVLPLLFLMLTFCITITNILQPSSAGVGEQIDVTLDIAVIPAEDVAYNVILGILVPEDWDVASNAVATYTSDNGSGTFAPSPNGVLASQMRDLVGIGKNYGRVKWVAFVSDGQVTGTNGVGFSGQIQISMTVGDENIKTQLGYVVATSGWGISEGNIGTRFPDCFEVTGGDNPLIDLCGPLPFPVTLKPAEFTLDDIIKITFDGTKGLEGSPTQLMGEDSVYLCGTVTADGVSKEVCIPNATSRLTEIGPDLWEISIWGKQFFDLPFDAEITEISFNFMNEAGDIVVRNPDTGEDFQLIANCTN